MKKLRKRGFAVVMAVLLCITGAIGGAAAASTGLRGSVVQAVGETVEPATLTSTAPSATRSLPKNTVWQLKFDCTGTSTYTLTASQSVHLRYYVSGTTPGDYGTGTKLENLALTTGKTYYFEVYQDSSESAISVTATLSGFPSTPTPTPTTTTVESTLSSSNSYKDTKTIEPTATWKLYFTPPSTGTYILNFTETNSSVPFTITCAPSSGTALTDLDLTDSGFTAKMTKGTKYTYTFNLVGATTSVTCTADLSEVVSTITSSTPSSVTIKAGNSKSETYGPGVDWELNFTPSTAAKYKLTVSASSAKDLTGATASTSDMSFSIECSDGKSSSSKTLTTSKLKKNKDYTFKVSYSSSTVAEAKITAKLTKESGSEDKKSSSSNSSSKSSSSSFSKIGDKATAGSGATKATYTKTGASTVAYTKTDISSTATTATVPATVTIEKKKYTVTQIASNAFKGKSKLKSVTVSKNVRTIKTSAFSGAAALRELDVKSKTLTASGVGGCLKGSHVEKIYTFPSKLLAYKAAFSQKNTGSSKQVDVLSFAAKKSK